VVKLLLEMGQADVNAKDSNGYTTLLIAAKRGQEATAKLLLETGQADVNAKDADAEVGMVMELAGSRTPLAWAASNGNEAVVKILY
jgi:ankyrin repeat protein